MAEQLKAVDGGNAPANHNEAEVLEIIRKCGDELNELEDEKAAIAARHKTELEPVKKKIKKAKADIKAAGIDIEDVDYWRRVARLEDERKPEALGNIKMVFNALGFGEQLDWVEAQAA